MEVRAKRFLSLVLAIVLTIGVIPTNMVFAEGNPDTPGGEEQVESTTDPTTGPKATTEPTADPTVVVTEAPTEEPTEVPTGSPTDPLTEPDSTEEPTKPVCTGLVDCAAENHLEECQKNLAAAEIMATAEDTLEESGVCGENVRWEYHYVPSEDSIVGDNVLYIIGTGDMTDFASSDDVPWPYGAWKSLDAVYISDGVTSIGNYAFSNSCPAEVILPDSITRIGDYAFYGATILKNITFSANLVSIGEHAFANCTPLSNLSFPESLKSIGSEAFSSCIGLEHVDIPASVTSIGSSAFRSCSGLISARLPASLTRIEGFLFANCSNLANINIPSSVTSIGSYAFWGCESLTSIEFPDGLLTIEENAFETNSNLEIAHWPLSLTTIHKDAFGSFLVYVTDVYYAGTEEDRAKIDDGNEYSLPLPNANWHYGTSDPDYPTNLGLGIQAQVVNGSDALTVYGGRGQVSTHILLTYEDGNSSIPAALTEVEYLVTNTSTGKRTMWDTVSTNEHGIVAMPLHPKAVPFEENVSLMLQITRVGEDVVNSEYSIPITVTVTSHTPLEQSWELSKAQALKLGASVGGGGNVLGIEFMATALELGVSGGSGAGMGVSHSVDAYGHRELSMSGKIKSSFGAEIGSGIKASYDGFGEQNEIEGTIIGVNASVEQDNFKNYSMKISNYNPGDNEHQRAIALFSLNQFYTMCAQNSLLFQLTNRINMKSSHEDIHYEIGTGKIASGELEAGVGSLSFGETDIFGETVIIDTAVGTSVKVISQTEKSIDNSGNKTHSSSLEVSEDLITLKSGTIGESQISASKYLLGSNSSAKAMVPTEGDIVLQISGLEQGTSTQVLWNERTVKNYRTYEMKYSNPAFVHCLENVDGMLDFINDGGIVSQSNYEDLSAFVDTSSDPISYMNNTEISEGVELSLDFNIAAGLKLGAAAEVVYQSTSSYPYAQGFTLNGYDYTLYESDEGVTESITLKEIIFESFDAIADDISQWVKSVAGSIFDGIINTMALIKDAYDGVSDINYHVTLVTIVNEPSANKSMQIDAINPTEPALMALEAEAEYTGNLRGAFTVGTPAIITVKHPETGEDVDDFSNQPMELTLQFRIIDLEETGVVPDDLEEGRIIGICRYLEEQNYYEFCGGIYNSEDQSVTAQITKPGQYILAILDHSWIDATCTTPKTCNTCGATEEDALGHDMGDWTVAETEDEERHDCSRCDYFETRPIQQHGDVLKLEGEDLLSQNTVWINGLPHPVKGDGENRYVEFVSEEDCMMVTYAYHVGDANDVHTQYPTGMKVYKVSGGKITYIPELDNILQYSGSSIRITGKKGIRMITSLNKSTKAALTGKGMAGYTLVEYGTTLCWASEIAEGDALVLGRSFTRSNYAYRKGVADPVFANTGNLTQYTNVLVGFTNDQCKDDIAMRPYIILADADGNQITLYGGTIYRSIGYIAYQNRNAFQPKTAAYNYVWEIIHHVYGNKYDADYKG